MAGNKHEALERAIEIIESTISQLTALNIDEVDDAIYELENAKDAINVSLQQANHPGENII